MDQVIFLDSLFPHMHTPSALLGRTISQMANNQVIHTTTVTKAIQPPSQPSKMSTPYIGGQSSMGIQTLAGGKPSATGKCFTRGNLRGCNINKPGGKPLLQVLLSLLPLVYILDNHFQELLILCGFRYPLSCTSWICR
jgi:hypothetical protein